MNFGYQPQIIISNSPHHMIARSILLLILASLFPHFSAAQEKDSVLVPFWDDFQDNRHAWPEFKEPSREAAFVEEGYLLAGKSTALPVFVPQNIPSIELDSFRIDLTLTQLDGKKNMGYGLFWGARPDQRDFYAFLISSNQQFTILRMERGQYRQIQPWLDTDIIHEAKESNVLSVEKRGGKYYYYLNGKRVFVGPADELKGPLVGVLYHGTLELLIEEFAVDLPAGG